MMISSEDGNDVTYSKYPEVLHDNWFGRAAEKLEDKFRGDFVGDRPRSRRTDMHICMMPLSEDKVQETARNAESREDFHDYNKIMGKPLWGMCLCAIRIISGEKCANHFKKDKDGPDGKCPDTAKDHWVWQLDIAPNRIVCPFARKNSFTKCGDYVNKPCDILIKKPPPDWVLAHHPEDPAGVVAGRIATDLFRKDELCPKCDADLRGVPIEITEDNELKESQIFKFSVPEEYKNPSTRPWWPYPTGYFDQPVKFMPNHLDFEDRILEVQGYYHHYDLDTYKARIKDRFVLDIGMTWEEAGDYYRKQEEDRAELERQFMAKLKRERHQAAVLRKEEEETLDTWRRPGT
jgi:hypothetical protein